MRKENYFIALINKECIKFNIPFFESKQLLTDILAWNVQWCINNFVYDKNGHVKEYFLDKEKKYFFFFFLLTLLFLLFFFFIIKILNIYIYIKFKTNCL